MPSIYRPYTEKLGGTDTSTYVGNQGDLFYDPTSTNLKISDGVTAGGKSVGVTTFASVSAIPSGFVGTARVGTDLYVGDGGTIKLANLKLKPQIPVLPLVRQIMSSPPTTTFTTTATIASPTAYLLQSTGTSATTLCQDFYTISGTKILSPKGTAYPDYYFINEGFVHYSNTLLQSNSYTLNFLYSGSGFELMVKGQTGSLLCKIDGKYISLTEQAVPNDGGIYYWYIPISGSGLHEISIRIYNSPLGGVFTSATDTLIPRKLRGPKTVVLGDSFGEGALASNTQGYIHQLADMLGWENVWSNSVGSTGLINNGGTNPDTTQKINYQARIPLDVIPQAPDVVIIQGSVNDIAYSASQITTAMTNACNLIKQSLPNCIIYATSPMPYTGIGGTPVNAHLQAAATKSVVESFGGYFINLLEIPMDSGVIPFVATLAASASSGATSISVSTGVAPVPHSTVKWSDGTRSRIKTITGTGPYTVTLDAGLTNSQSSGNTLTQVGGSIYTGSGKVGATTGFGNCDIFVLSDGTHPTLLGHGAIASAIANQIIFA